MPKSSVRDAVVTLAKRDRVLADLIDRFGPPPGRRPVPVDSRFAALARAIVYQQLAGRAASAIHGRFVEALGGSVTAASVLAVPLERLTGAGLSGSKAASIRDLAEKVQSGEVALDHLGRSSDDDVVEHLTRVRGIGPWTAHMFLLVALARLDVWPVGDYGVRAGFARAWELPEIPKPADLELLGDPFRPYRSLVAWYCWRVMDTFTL